MQENYIVPTTNTELIVYNEPEVSIVRSKRRKKGRKPWKRKLITALLFIIIAYFSVIGYPKIKDFIIEMQPQKSEKQADTPTNDDNTVNTNTAPKEKYSFIHTSPTKMSIINESAHKIDSESLSYTFPKAIELYNTYSDTSPIVLIVHYSPKEAYTTTNGYSEKSSFYSDTDNVSAIGKEMCNALNERGINTLHLSSYGYEGGLANGKELYEQAIRDTLNSHPSISYIFDISRSIIINSDFSMKKEEISVNGINCPTIKFSCGTSSSQLTEESRKSIFLMNQLTSLINEKHPLLVSEQLISAYTLSQIFNVPMLRADIGSFASTYEEARLSANLLVSCLADYLNN